MTDDPSLQRWRELSWRRKLTGAEQAELRAWLGAHPEAHAEWEAESALNEALNRLPEAPVCSNFTARVLAAVERDKLAAARSRPAAYWPPWKKWLPRFAVAAVVLGAGLFSYHESVVVRRAKMVRSVEAVSKVSLLPSPAILEDFDAIQRLTPAPAADETLLSLLQ
jgi:anti-sigma factor RsiW